MLNDEERRVVLDAIRRYGYLPRREMDRVRDRADEELPYDLVARAAVEDPSPRVRWLAVDLLDHYADDRHVDALLAASRDAVARVRRHAVHALACTTCKRTDVCEDVVPALVERALTDENTYVRRHAAWGLMARTSDRRAVDALAGVAASDPDDRVRRHAAAALAR